MRCACTQEGSANNAKLVLCDLHACEFHRRIDDMRGPDDNAVWNAALSAVEAKLIRSDFTWADSSPIDAWIQKTIDKLRK